MKRFVMSVSPVFLSAIVFLSGCGGGGGSSSSPGAAPIPSKNAASAVFQITVQLTQSQAASRNPQYISPNTQSVSILLVSVNGTAVNGSPTVANIAATASGCTQTGSVITCSVPVPTQPGSDVYSVSTFAGPNATGATLSAGQTTANIVAGMPNIVPVTLNGVVASIIVALGTTAPNTGTPSVIPVTVTAKDPSGATIIGPGNYNVPITLTDSDTSGATSLSTTSVTAPSQAVNLNYNGSSSLTSATIGATATGIAPSNITPAVVTPKGGVGIVSRFINANAGGSLPLTATNGATFTYNVQPNALNADTTVTISEVSKTALPAPLSSARRPMFVGGAGNTYVYAFTVALGSAVLSVPISLSASNATTLPAGTTLNLAILQGATWVDVGTGTVGASGSILLQTASSSLPGIKTAGTYLLYQPAAGTSTAVANYGIALISDDGTLSGGGGLQIVNFYDPNGNPLATPLSQTLPFANAYDLDGAALTPDGSQGVMVDGGNTLRFFSGVQTGKPVASSATVALPYTTGGDGDSVAILPNGDEAVVAADGANMLVVSGILSGAPTAAELIPTSTIRDGVVISNDGKTLLAREGSRLGVFAIANIPPKAGSQGGMIAHSFTLVNDLTTISPYGEDGRDGMAFSPADSTRAVVIGRDSNYAPTVMVLTGLPNNPAIQSVGLRVPQGRTYPIPSSHQREHGRATTALNLSSAGSLYSVSVSQDGKLAVIGTSSGLVLVSGVDTGNLAQVGSVFAPTVTDGSGTSGPWQSIRTAAITLDNRYVVGIGQATSSGGGTLLVVPFNATGFGAPVGQLNKTVTPYNDQILIH